MKNFKSKKTLQIVLVVLIAVLSLGIGYAAISSANLIINGNTTASVDQNNFKVHFTGAQAISGSTGVSGTSTIDTQDDTKAMLDVTGLTKVGDYAEAVYTVRNDSNGIGAEITLNLESSNMEYFKVTETILDDKLQAGEETTAKVRVEMIKTPLRETITTNITATLTASPLEDAEATGGEETTVDENYYLYTTSVNDSYMKGNLSTLVGMHNNMEDAIADTFNGPILFKKIKVNNNTIIEKYIGHQPSANLIYIQYGVDESGDDNPVIFNNNVNILQSEYGNCTTTSTSISCTKNAFSANVNIDGTATIKENADGCDETFCGHNFPS